MSIIPRYNITSYHSSVPPLTLFPATLPDSPLPTLLARPGIFIPKFVLALQENPFSYNHKRVFYYRAQEREILKLVLPVLEDVGERIFGNNASLWRIIRSVGWCWTGAYT